MPLRQVPGYLPDLGIVGTLNDRKVGPFGPTSAFGATVQTTIAGVATAAAAGTLIAKTTKTDGDVLGSMAFFAIAGLATAAAIGAGIAAAATD